MTGIIYYFSGTGNSLIVAREIAEKTGCTLIPAASLQDKKVIKVNVDLIGIVFPVYYADTPLIIQRFAEKLDNINNKYVFAVCTYGGGVGDALNTLSRILTARGGKLAAGYGVHMPQNAFHKPWENHSRIQKKMKDKTNKICKKVSIRKEGGLWRDLLWYYILYPLNKVLFKPLTIKGLAKITNREQDLPLEQLIHLMDESYRTGAACTGCGLCKEVCPVDNIVINDRQPEWLNRCQNCLACYNWCPNRAIQGKIAQEGYYYTHPRISVQDIIKQKKTNSATP